MILNRIFKGLFKFILNSSLFSCLDDIILKMKKCVILWRKFELKRSYINEFLNFMEFSRIYFNFLSIFPDLIPLIKGKKCFNIRAGPAELM